MKDDKGFTLVEIVVAMIVMVIVFAGVFVAFMSIGKVNVVSRVSQTQTNIATAILESFYDTKFHDINKEMQFDLPESLKTENMSVDFTSNSSITAEPINIKLDNIRGVASTYSADVVVTPFSTDNENFKGFSSFDILGQKGTVILYTDKLASSDKTYDELALTEFKAKSDQYITEITKEDETPVYIPESELSKSLACHVNILISKKSSAQIEFKAEIKYDLGSKSNEYIGVSSTDTNGIISYDLFDGSSLFSLSNLLIFSSDREKINSFDITVQNGETTYDAAKFNIFLVRNDETLADSIFDFKHNLDIYTDIGVKSSSDFKFNFLQEAADKVVKVYTNIANVNNMGNLKDVLYQIYGDVYPQDRIYNVDITVREKATGTFEHLNETVLVMDYANKK